MSELPRGWVSACLGDVVSSMKNGLYKAAEAYADDGVVCLRMYNIDQGKVVLRDLKRMRLSEAEVQEYGLLPGDLLVNRVNSRELVGKTATIPESLGVAVFESKNIRVRLIDEAVSPQFVSLQLLNGGSRYFANNAQQVVGMASISQTQIAGYPILLAPKREQARVVEKLDELFSDLDAGIAALERARANLKRYRATVLKAAIDGRLTEKWRAAHPDTESAGKLLERILAERRKKWEQAQLKKYAEKGHAPPQGWKDKYVEPAKPDVASLEALPTGWCWATIEQCSWEVTVGHVGPMKERYEETGLPFLRSQNVRPFRFDREGLKFISKKFDAELSKSRLFGGEVLAVRSGNIGDACVFPNTEGRANCADLVITRLVSSMDAGYVVAYLNSPVGRTRVIGKQTGSALPHFNVGAMARSVIPLPPATEQAQIATYVAERLSQGEEALVEMERSRLRASRLRQAILKCAFEGKLVPQDPQDEPASELLARIRAAREVDKGLIGQRNDRSKIRKKIRIRTE